MSTVFLSLASARFSRLIAMCSERGLNVTQVSSTLRPLSLCFASVLLSWNTYASELPVAPKQPETKKLEQTLKEGEAQKRFLSSEKKTAIELPSAVTDNTDCVTIKKIMVAEIWVNQQGEQLRLFDVTLPACLTRAELMKLISSEVSQRREKGFLVTSAKVVTPNDTDILKAELVTIEVRVLGVQKFNWPQRDTQISHYGWRPDLNQPLNVRQLDSVIESFTRLNRNDPLIDILPDEKNQVATVQVKNTQKGPFQGWLAFNRDENRRLDASASAEDLTGYGEKNTLMLSRTQLSQGESNTFNWFADLPIGAHLIDARVRKTKVNRTLPLDTGDLDYQQSETEFAMNWSRSIYRNASNIVKLTAGARGLNLRGELGGEQIVSQSPNLRMFELDLNWQSLALGGMVLTDYKIKHGLSGLGASSDVDLGVVNKTAAHAQFLAHQIQAIYIRKLTENSPRSLIAVLQGFYANHGLYPAESFSLASSYAVEGNIRENTLVDYGVTARLGINNLLSGKIGSAIDWQTNFAIAMAQGKRYIGDDRLHLNSMSLDFNLRNKNWAGQFKFSRPIKKNTVTQHDFKTEFNLQWFM